MEAAIASTPRERPIRVAVLKYRQCGMSTYACGKMQHGCMHHPGVTGLTIADKLDLPEQWLRRGRQWLSQIKPQTSWMIPNIKASNFREMWFDKIGSRYFISSAEAKTPGVGATLHLFHGSECALWLHPAEIERQTWQGIPTVGGSMVLLESTGEALGDWWWRLWTDAKAGRNDFDAIFLSWLIQDEYRMPADDILDLTKAEQELTALGADRKQLAWRRWKIRNDLGGSEESFANQFPHTPEVAFLSGGRSIFNPEQVNIARATERGPIWRGDIKTHDTPAKYEVVGSDGGALLTWEEPDDRYHYAIGADCQWGTSDRADFDSGWVECLETARVVARLHGHWQMGTWACKLASLGYHYNIAPLAPERNSEAATGVIAVLLGLTGNHWRYPNVWIRSTDVKLRGYRPEDYGWLTNHHSKAEIIAFAQLQTLAGGFDWCDSLVVDQMASFIRDDAGKLTAPDGAYDDALMGRMITAFVAHRVRPLTDLYVEPVVVPLVLETVQDRARHHLGLDEGEEDEA